MSKKKIRKAKSKKAYKVRLKPSTVLSIVQIVFYSLAGLIIVSFSRRGLILVRLNDFLLLLFSWTTIFVPFIFVSLGLLVSKLRVPIAQPNVIVGALLFFISIMSLTKAGSLGLAAWDGIATLITGAGAAIVLFGSYAKDRFTPDSDIDLAIFLNTDNFDGFLEDVKLMHLRRKVDLRIEPHPFARSDFDETNPFIKEIITTGKRII